MTPYEFGDKLAFELAQSRRESVNVEDRRNQEPPPDLMQIRSDMLQSRDALNAQRKKVDAEAAQWHWPWSARPEAQKYFEMSRRHDAILSKMRPAVTDEVARANKATTDALMAHRAWRPAATPQAAAVDRFVVDQLGPRPQPVKKPIRYFQPEPGKPFAREFDTPKQPDITAETSHMMATYAPTSIVEEQRQKLQNQKETNDMREFSAAYYPDGFDAGLDMPGPTRGISPKNWSTRPRSAPSTQVATAQSRSPSMPSPSMPSTPITSTAPRPKQPPATPTNMPAKNPAWQFGHKLGLPKTR